MVVFNPNRAWRSFPATIEKATIAIKPVGVYSEVGLYLTISDRGSNFSQGEQLEIVLDFDLPEGSMIHDSWLWVGNDIIRAKILDKWTAGRIYEDIVDRRQDPSILYKLGPNRFQLRVYPLFAGDSRKLKITYLVPNFWTSEKVLSTMPSHILNLSNAPIEDAKLLVWESQDFLFPEMRNIDFQTRENNVLGNHFIADISSPVYEDLGDLNYDAPLTDGVYLNRLIDGDDQFYQLAVSPNFLFDETETNKRILVLFDFDSQNSTIDEASIILNVKNKLKQTLSKSDQFNLMKSGLRSEPVLDNWINGTHDNIDKAFEDLGGLNSYSNLPSLLTSTVEYLEDHALPNTNVLLVSNTDEFARLDAANDFLDDFGDLSEELEVPFHTFYFQNRNFNRVWLNNNYYHIGQYVYSNLSTQTGGEFVSEVYTSNISTKLDEVITTLNEPAEFFDFHTTLENGFCHSRYTNIDEAARVYPNQAIVQVGKFEGDFPFKINMNASLYGNIASEEIVVNEMDVWQGDSLVREAWYGNRLAELEANSQTAEQITQIINESLRERVLSVYTALLCLEPNQGGEPCPDCFDEDGNISSVGEEEIPSDSILVEVAPNPFVEQVTINVTKPEVVKTSEVTCQIFNTVGMPVVTLEGVATADSKVQFQWDGSGARGKAASGMYVAVLKIGDERRSVKLIYQP